MRAANLTWPGAATVAAPRPEERSRVRIAIGRAGPPMAGVTMLDLRLQAWADGRALTPASIHATAERLRDAYIDYISAIGCQSTDPAWWTGCVAERNPFVSQAFHLLTRVAAAVEAVEARPGGWLLVSDEPAVAEALAETLAHRGHEVEVSSQGATTRVLNVARLAAELVARRMYFVAKWTRRILGARLAGARRRAMLAASAGRPLTIVQTWLDRRCFDEATGVLSDFANFAEIKRRLGAEGHAVMTMPFVLRSVSFGAAIKAALAAPEPVLLPEAYMTLGDVWRIAARSMVASRTHRQYPPLGGVHGRALFERDETREWVHHRRLENDLLDTMVTRWRRAGLQVERVIHTFEAHTWERVLARALQREYPRAWRVGFLNPALSRFRLNEFITADEWSRAPLPDRVVTYGPLATAYLQAAGAPPERLVTGAAPWLQRLVTGSADDSNGPEQRAVLVVFSIDAVEGRELLERVRLAFTSRPDVGVWLKFHPTLPFERLRPSIPLPPHFSVVDRPLADLLLDVPVALYGSTGACLEVLASGVAPVHIRLTDCLDQDPLEFWPGLRDVADDQSVLRDITLRHLHRTAGDRTVRRERGRRALGDYFGREAASFYGAFIS